MNSSKGSEQKFAVSLTDILIGISILIFGVYMLTGRDQDGLSEIKAVIYKNNTVIAEVPLDKDTRFDLESSGVSMTLEIRNRKIRVVSSSCRQQICVRKGWSGNIHDPIICVPNDIIIDITGDEPEYDAISH